MRRRLTALLMALLCLTAAACGAAENVAIVWEEDAEPFPEGAELLTLTVFPLVGSDCMLLTFGEHTMLVDTGDLTMVKDVDALLKAMGITRVDTVFCTHPHADHIGAMIPLIRRGYEFGEYINFFPHDYYEKAQNVVQEKTIAAVEAAGIPIVEGKTEDTFAFGGAVCTAYRIPDERIEKTMNCNSISAMLMVRYGDCSILLTGDVEEYAQGILASLYDLDADILKFPHHGLNKANPNFLGEVSPLFTFFTNGSNRTKQEQEQLRRSGFRRMTFSSWGTITFRTDGTRWTVRQDFTDGKIRKHAEKFFSSWQDQ